MSRIFKELIYLISGLFILSYDIFTLIGRPCFKYSQGLLGQLGLLKS